MGMPVLSKKKTRTAFVGRMTCLRSIMVLTPSLIVT